MLFKSDLFTNKVRRNGLIAFVFISFASMLCLNTLYSQSASAYSVGDDYTVYFKSGYTLYFNRVLNSFDIVQFIPRVTVDKDACDASGSEGPRDFNSYQQYWNCHGLYIQEDNSASAPAGNGKWFEEANYAYQLGDVDWAEKVEVGGGTITAHGESTNDPTNSGHNIQAKSGNGPYTGWDHSCDTDNPNKTDHCSVLFKSTTDTTDFHIFFEAPGTETKHEFWYDGLKEAEYRTLRFHPNGSGATVSNSPADSEIWAHMSGSDLYREYKKDTSSSNYPTASWSGHYFVGWNTSSDGGGSWKSSRVMSSDEDLYAIWIDWDISPYAIVDRATAQPGDLITWTHSVVNNGPDNTHLIVSYDYINQVDFPTPYADGSDTAIAAGWMVGNSYKNSKNSSYTVISDDGGKRLCRATRAWPRASDDSGMITSGSACTDVPYNYVLTPVINVAPPIVEAGAKVNIEPSVSNPGPTRSKTTTWQLSRIVLPVGSAVPSGGASSSAPCSFFSGCTLYKTGTAIFHTYNTITKISGDDFLSSQSDVVDPGLDVGQIVCYSLSVKDRSSSDSRWQHAIDCSKVGKGPKFQVWGGDLKSGGSVMSNLVEKSNYSFASWVEYGILSVNSINATGSASSFASLSGLQNADKNIYSKLSFANYNNTCPVPSVAGASNIGCYLPSVVLPNIAANFPDGTNLGSSTITPSSLGSGIYKVGTVTINGSNLASGQSVIIKSSGTVTIAGDQTYSNGSYANIQQLPQLVVIANKIIINSNVKRVDGWLLAGYPNSSNNPSQVGVIETCNTGSSTYILTGTNRLTGNKCNQQLIVNGPVVSTQIWLRRTFGAEESASIKDSDPAERFNMRADAYLWARSKSINIGSIRTVYTTQLPPRY